MAAAASPRDSGLATAWHWLLWPVPGDVGERTELLTGIVPILLAIIPFSQIPLDAYTPALPQMVRDLAADPAAVPNTVTA